MDKADGDGIILTKIPGKFYPNAAEFSGHSLIGWAGSADCRMSGEGACGGWAAMNETGTLPAAAEIIEKPGYEMNHRRKKRGADGPPPVRVVLN